MQDSQLSNENVRAFYDSAIDKKYDGDYEFRRWHRNLQDRSDYRTTHEAITRRLGDTGFSNYIELGPGPGTWTTIFFRKNPDAHFTLIDISKEMAKQFLREMRGGLSNVQYVVSDILSFDGKETCDLFFSSRALEYVDDKPKAIAKVYALMESGARGYIVTKNPERGLRRRIDSRPLHQGQISVPDLTHILEQQGFSKIEAYAATVRVPAGRFLPAFVRIAIAERLHKKIIDRKFSATSRWLSRVTESYLVTFVKP